MTPTLRFIRAAQAYQSHLLNVAKTWRGARNEHGRTAWHDCVYLAEDVDTLLRRIEVRPRSNLTPNPKHKVK